ncbi:AAA family ATPase [Sandarakinorhabdus limnophila]|uniref:AAA family ATPase n=1 Tax=Sandarakinorhabdus limnophila TaxID=210512 RepID=UPI0026EC5605|nr:AAA family ATPase [Sandarakinorhabdus limnophila]
MLTLERQISIGSLIALAKAGGWDASSWMARATSPTPANTFPVTIDQFDIANIWNNIPHRAWLLPPYLVAKHYSMLVATGASGKSAIAITMALALLTGREDLLGVKVVRPCRVLLINGEDGHEELVRRIRATCLHFGIDLPEIAHRLKVIGARQVPGLTLNRLQPGGVVADQAGLDKLEDLIRQSGADVVILDPLSSFLPGGTNDGASASAVAGRLTEICVSAGCAMLLVHHTSKAAQREGDNDPTAALGSAMWANHARSVLNLRRPTDFEAQAIGRLPSAIRDLLVLLHSKANLSRAEDAIFFEMVGVELPNAEPPLFPNGDKIGVATRLLPGASAGLFSPAMEAAAVARIAAAATTSIPYKASGRRGRQDFKPDIAVILASHFPGESQVAREKLAKILIAHLINSGRVVISHEPLPRAGKGKGGGKSDAVLRVANRHVPAGAGTGAPQGTNSILESMSASVHGQSVPAQGGTELPLGGVGESGAPETSHQRSET